MSTKELKRKLTKVGRSAEGARNVFVKRSEKYVSPEAQEEFTADICEGEHESQADRGAHTTGRPMMVMVDEPTGNKYMRVVSHKGLGPDGDATWLIKDMHQE